MTNEQIKAIFEKVYNGQTNFMTPEVVSYHKKGNLLLEISIGKGIFQDTIYGATFLRITDKGYEKCNFNKCVNSAYEALEILSNHAEMEEI